MKTPLLPFFAGLLSPVFAANAFAEPTPMNTPSSIESFDIVVYGGTSAGVIAGLQALKDGRSVVVLAPTAHIGGLTTGGLGQTDIGNKQVVGGLSREFYRRIRAHYRDPANWKWQSRENYSDNGQTRTHAHEDAMWTFEPSAAQAVLNAMIEESGLPIRTGARLRRDGTGVVKNGSRITRIYLDDGRDCEARVFIDATYEGDLLAEAGVSFSVGRESNDAFGETLNGAQPQAWRRTLRGMEKLGADEAGSCDSYRHPYFQNGLVSMNAHWHQLKRGISPWRIAGDPASGVLPGIDTGPMAANGTGDLRVQAYNYRITLTDHPENRIPIGKPAGYDPADYELFVRHILAHGPDEWPTIWINSPMPNRKTDTNNGGGFSTNLIGQNWHWPEASYAEREACAARLKNHVLGLLWTAANHPEIRQDFRDWVGAWGLPRDEYADSGHFSPEVYVREGRRMTGSLVLTQRHCERLVVESDSVGMAAYGMDSHHVRRYITEAGDVQNEGNVQGHVTAPYPISYRALLPRPEEAGNLIVPVAVSATHIAFGSIRMEPVFMVLGQSAAAAASLSLKLDTPLHALPYGELRATLLALGQVLEPIAGRSE